MLNHTEIFMRNILLSLLLSTFINKVTFSQTNICERDDKQKSELESNLCMQIHLNGAAVNIRASTGSLDVGSFYVIANNKGVFTPLDRTMIGLNANKNQSWALYYALIYDNDKHLMTDSAYAGYSKWEYGDEAEQYLMKIKKRRIYPENNIYTESITFSNGIIFIVENRIYVRKVTFPDGQTLNIPNYIYEEKN